MSETCLTSSFDQVLSEEISMSDVRVRTGFAHGSLLIADYALVLAADSVPGGGGGAGRS